MKKLILFVCLYIFASCQTTDKQSNNRNIETHFFVGTYTNNESEGIYSYKIDSAGNIFSIGLAAATKNPSFLAKTANNKFLLAVNETNPEGSIKSYKIDKDTLILVSNSSSGGENPCFVTSNSEGIVLAANYSSGTIGLLKLNNEGQLSKVLAIEKHIGNGTTSRQESAHAHSVWFLSNEKIVSADLGSNQLWFSTIKTLTNPIQIQNTSKLSMENAAGPRHLAFHPNQKWFYVFNELNSSISLIKKAPNNSYALDTSFSTLPINYNGKNQGADIHISSEGKFIYASNRGHNSIAVFEIDNQMGNLNPLEFKSVHGNWPRNFAFSPDEKYLIVANKLSNNIISFKRNKKTGLLTYVNQIYAPNPVCIAF